MFQKTLKRLKEYIRVNSGSWNIILDIFPSLQIWSISLLFSRSWSWFDSSSPFSNKLDSEMCLQSFIIMKQNRPSSLSILNTAGSERSWISESCRILVWISLTLLKFQCVKSLTALSGHRASTLDCFPSVFMTILQLFGGNSPRSPSVCRICEEIKRTFS